MTNVTLPHPSVTLYVLVIVSGQVAPSVASLTKATANAAGQLSASSVITLTSGAGTSAMQSTVTGAGLEAVGGVMSLIVIVWVTRI